MKSQKNYWIIAFLICTLFNCTTVNNESKHYENQIGDTPFDAKKDDLNFKFCDSTKVLHKRALIQYNGGKRNLEKELIESYHFNPNFKSFSGYFIIRFAVNCNNETGRFRMEVLDLNFKPAKASIKLKNHILNINKALKNWNHAIYNGEDHDCYRFITIKMVNGKIIKS